MHEQIGVAVVGYGYWGPNLVRNMKGHPACDVRWVCDTDAARVAKAEEEWGGAGTTDLAKVLDDPRVDLVAVATPISTHYEVAKAALMANKQVLVEKPLTADVAQAEELVALAADRGLQLFVDHTYLFTPEIRAIKEILDKGELGELLYMDAVRINLGLFQRDHDVIWDLAPHDVSIFLYLLGRLPESVLATGASHTPSGLADVAMVHLDFGGELVANVHVNWLSPVKIRHTIFAGRKRMLVFNDLNLTGKVQIYDRGIEVSTPDVDARREVLIGYRTGDMRAPFIPHREALRLEVDELVACLRGEAEPTSSGRAGADAVRVLAAMSRSLDQKGARIHLSDL